MDQRAAIEQLSRETDSSGIDDLRLAGCADVKVRFRKQ